MSTERETAAGAKYWERPLYEQTRAIVSKAAQEYADANSKTDCVNWATREVLALLAPQPRSTEGAELVEQLRKPIAIHSGPSKAIFYGGNSGEANNPMVVLLQMVELRRIEGAMLDAARLLASPADARETLPAQGEVEPKRRTLVAELRETASALDSYARGFRAEGFEDSAWAAEKRARTVRDAADALYRRAERAEPDGALRELIGRLRDAWLVRGDYAEDDIDVLRALCGEASVALTTAPQRAGTEGE